MLRKSLSLRSAERTSAGTGPLEKPLDDPSCGTRALDLSSYDFIDFGCSTGGSLRHCLKRFGASSGIGVDVDPAKVRAAQEQGLSVLLGDLHELPGRDVVRFVSMMQFLEHLENLREVERVIAKAASLATDFLYIHHPSFEDEHYLLSEGLRLYYHHWSGHLTHVRLTDFFEIFERLGLFQYHARPIKPISSSNDPTVIPSSAAINQHEYDEASHGPKPNMQFPHPIYQHIEIFLALRPFQAEEWRAIVIP